MTLEVYLHEREQVQCTLKHCRRLVDQFLGGKDSTGFLSVENKMMRISILFLLRRKSIGRLKAFPKYKKEYQKKCHKMYPQSSTKHHLSPTTLQGTITWDPPISGSSENHRLLKSVGPGKKGICEFVPGRLPNITSTNPHPKQSNDRNSETQPTFLNNATFAKVLCLGQCLGENRRILVVSGFGGGFLLFRWI